MNESSYNKININKVIFFCFTLVVSILSLFVTVNALQCSTTSLYLHYNNIYGEANTALPQASTSCSDFGDGQYAPTQATADQICKIKGYDSASNFVTGTSFSSPYNNYYRRFNGNAFENICANNYNPGSLDEINCIKTTCIQCSTNIDCNDNNPHTQDVCLNPSTVQSSCQHNNIVCNSNSECGTNAFIGNLVCQNNNVFQNYITYTCNNQGTASSSCTSSTNSQLKQTCTSGQTCSGGKCNNPPMFLPNMPICNGNFGTVTGTSDLNVFNTGHHNSNTPEDYVMNNDKDLTKGSSLDWNWVWTSSPNYIQWDMGKLTNYLRVYPSQDHDPYSTELNEYDVKVSNDGTNWFVPTYINTYVDDINNVKTHDGVKDYYSSQKFRYVRITPNSLGGGDYELDAIQECSGSIICNNNEECNDNNTHTQDVCLNPGKFNSSCQHNNIVCLDNSDCGTDGFIGNLFCTNDLSNIFQNYNTFTCNNPGTTSSTCSNKTEIKVKSSCNSNQVCSNGNCVKKCVDSDTDGYDNCNPGECGDDGKQIDCNDNNPWVHPNAFEYCDGIDNNCNGVIDEGCNNTIEHNPPVVNLISPANNSTFSYFPYEVNFKFNVTDESDIKSCFVITNGQTYQNTSTVSKTQTNSIKVNLNPGNYSAYVTCTDQFDNEGDSNNINFSVLNNTNNSTCVNDHSSPGTITNLHMSSNGVDYIYLEWTNPSDSDFSKNIIYKDGVEIARSSNNYYKVIGLNDDTTYKIIINTIDNCGNINNSSVSIDAKTKQIINGGGCGSNCNYNEPPVIYPDYSINATDIAYVKTNSTIDNSIITIKKSNTTSYVWNRCTILIIILIGLFLILLIILFVLIAKSQENKKKAINKKVEIKSYY